MLIDDSTKAKRGKAMDAVAKMNEPTRDAYVRGQQSVCGLLLVRGHVIPVGIRLYVKTAQWAALELPFRNTTAVAGQLSRALQAPVGVQVLVLVDTDYLGPTVVQACREQRCHCASTVKSHRSLFKQGWQLHTGRYGRKLFRRRRTDTLALAKPYGSVRYRLVEAGGLAVSTLGPLHAVFARQGTANKILGLVTDAPQLSAADVIRTYDKRWTLEPWIKDAKPRLGLGHYQHRSSWAAVTPRHLVCFASALPDPPAHRATRCTRRTDTSEGG